MHHLIPGYTRVATVNLTQDSVSIREVDEKLAYDFIGGRGWAAKMLFEVPRKVGPFDPENPLIVAAGPLTLEGYPPFGSRTTFAAISPATGSYGDSNVGGFLGLRMRKAGYDALVITGTAKDPKYVVVNNDDVEIRDAGELWGKGSRLTDEIIRSECGEDFSVASIGPAGEKLVKFACINVDWDRKRTRHGQAGRTGLGAVMGSKKLKAIAVAGNKDVPIANPHKLEEIAKRAGRFIAQNPMMPLSHWLREGTMSAVDWSNTVECLPTLNFKKSHFEFADKINAGVMRQKSIALRGCSNCSTPCEHLSKNQEDAEEVRIAVEYETAALLGSNLGLDNFEEVMKANYLCDDLGLDTISCGVVIGFVMEAFERDLISPNELGFEPRFGDADSVYRIIRMIAERESLGDTMAEGVKTLAASLGKDSQSYAMHVKGLEISGYDHRAAPAMALSYATCDIGAHHSRSWAITYDVKGDRNSYGDDKADHVIYLQHVRPMFDMLGVCRFQYIEMGLDPAVYAEAYSAVVGKDFSLQDLLWRSERMWNLTRAIGAIRKGMGIEDDRLPERDFDDPVPEGFTKGSRIDREKFQNMLQTYYSKRGWTKGGIPSREKLIQLDLHEAVRAIYG